MKTCITGASGFIGKRLVLRLEEAGDEIRLLTRKKIGPGNLSTNNVHFVADLTGDAPDLHGLMDGVDVVYHCAGEVNNAALMHPLHVNGTAKLMREVQAHISRTGLSLHWVQLSSIGVYGPPSGRPDDLRVVNEASPLNPVGEYETTKAHSDELVIEYARSEPRFTYSILRPSIVIAGNMTNQSVKSLVSAIKRKLFFYIGSSEAISTYIHVDDVVEALLLCGTDIKAGGQIFNLSNDCYLSEIVQAIHLHHGIRSRVYCVPELPLRVGIKLFSMALKLPLTQDRIDALMKRTRYPNKKIKELLDFSPRHSIPD